MKTVNLQFPVWNETKILKIELYLELRAPGRWWPWPWPKSAVSPTFSFITFSYKLYREGCVPDKRTLDNGMCSVVHSAKLFVIQVFIHIWHSLLVFTLYTDNAWIHNGIYQLALMWNELTENYPDWNIVFWGILKRTPFSQVSIPSSSVP